MQVRCGAPVSGVSVLDSADQAMRAFAGRAIRPVGDGNEAWIRGASLQTEAQVSAI